MQFLQQNNSQVVSFCIPFSDYLLHNLILLRGTKFPLNATLQHHCADLTFRFIFFRLCVTSADVRLSYTFIITVTACFGLTGLPRVCRLCAALPFFSSNCSRFFFMLKKSPLQLLLLWDHLCGIVVRVPGYRFRGPSSTPGVTRFSET
jgi:hypothetical protein